MKHVSIAVLVVLCGCASSGSNKTPDAGGGDGDGGGGEIDAPPDDDIDAGGTAAMCPTGQFATNIAGNGDVTCTTLDAATATAVRARCSVYLGLRDGCNGCTDPPSKWSQSTPISCSPGSGGGNTCITATLDNPNTPVSLATLDLDGDTNGDDKFFAGLHCVAVPREPRPAPCLPGWAISFKSGSSWMCTPVSESAVQYVGSRCNIYLGWRDSCDGCNTAPTKWGYANDASCTNGAGADNTCVTATLGTESVRLFGLSTDGDVNGDDKFHVGLACPGPDATLTSTTEVCPAGQFLVATHEDGSFSCGDPSTSFSPWMREHCTLSFGWRDTCGNCTQPPTKWGQVTTGSCVSGAGTEGTCTDTPLGDTTVSLFGLGTDGNVNDDDTFYLGLRCTE